MAMERTEGRRSRQLPLPPPSHSLEAHRASLDCWEGPAECTQSKQCDALAAGPCVYERARACAYPRTPPAGRRIGRSRVASLRFVCARAPEHRAHARIYLSG